MNNTETILIIFIWALAAVVIILLMKIALLHLENNKLEKELKILVKENSSLD